MRSYATGWTTQESLFDSRQGMEIFLFSKESSLALGPTDPPVQWVLGDMSLGSSAGA